METMPHCFKRNFGLSVTVVIDCFEIFTERPSDLQARALTWSPYKHHHSNYIAQNGVSFNHLHCQYLVKLTFVSVPCVFYFFTSKTAFFTIISTISRSKICHNTSKPLFCFFIRLRPIPDFSLIFPPQSELGV